METYYRKKLANKWRLPSNDYSDFLIENATYTKRYEIKSQSIVYSSSVTNEEKEFMNDWFENNGYTGRERIDRQRQKNEITKFAGDIVKLCIEMIQTEKLISNKMDLADFVGNFTLVREAQTFLAFRDRLYDFDCFMSRVLQIKYYYLKNQIKCPNYLSAFTGSKYIDMMRQSRQLLFSTDKITKILKMRYIVFTFRSELTCPERGIATYYDRYDPKIDFVQIGFTDPNCKRLISSYTNIFNRWKNGMESGTNSKMSSVD